MLQVVIDTNVLVRALIKPDSSDGKVFKRFLDGELELLYSRVLVTEIARVLTYPRLKQKYHLADIAIETFLRVISMWGRLVVPNKKVSLCRDPEDNELLAVAQSLIGDPVALITADDDLLVLRGQVEGVEIMKPQEFLARF